MLSADGAPSSPSSGAEVHLVADVNAVASLQGRYSIGMSGAFRTIAKGFNHSVLLVATSGGPTAAMYAWGKLIQAAAGVGAAAGATAPLIPKVADTTLSHIGYFTDDGAYYYQWSVKDGC